MAKVSTPLLGLLLACLAFFALWFVALKPSTSSTSSTARSSSTAASGHSSIPNGSAIDKAQAAVSTANRASAAQNNANATQSTSTTATSTLAARPAIAAPTTAAPSNPSTGAPATNPAGTASPSTTAKATKPATASHAPQLPASPAIADRALAEKKVLAILFYNPAAADDQAVRGELAAVPTENGLVVKLAVPLADLSAYSVVTNHVAVNESPTLVLVDGKHSATTIVGFADRFEIAQRVTDALAVG